MNVLNGGVYVGTPNRRASGERIRHRAQLRPHGRDRPHHQYTCYKPMTHQGRSKVNRTRTVQAAVARRIKVVAVHAVVFGGAAR